MMRGGLILGAMVVVGCAEGPPATVGGERLALTWNVFEDGSRQLETGEVRDLARGERCTPRRWRDGATYCTPGGRDAAGLVTVYADASCDEPALRAVDGGARAYALTLEGGAVTALHRTAPLALDAFWARDGAGACVGPYPGSGQRFYRRGAEVPVGALAPMGTEVIEGGGRVGLRAHTSPDGLRLPHALRDTAHGFDCIVRTTASGVATCLPPRQAALRFADAGCREPVVGQHELWPDVAPYVFAGAVCSPQGFVIGTELPAAPGYERVDGACRATAAPVGHRWFQAAPIELARVERRRLAAPGHRLQAIELVAGDLALVDRPRYDTGTGGECVLASSAAEPGVRRCLPQDPGYEHTYYTDAACTRPVPLANVFREAPMAKCGADLPPFAVAADRPGVYFRITDSRTEPVYRKDESGACTAAPYESLAGTPMVFELGEPVLASEFVAVQRTE